ncbi:MAG: prepilin-type N-terminal cleavage/methylation domain-containing protein [Candidatus Aadella gelida]|nr:prepilin-type N-terminal cleavage/methylation domain-containing protein [Candidatus Aadella gelida]
MKFRKRGRKGFTLIEILFVVVVIAILAAVVIPRLTTTALDAKKAANLANKANINTQVEKWYFDNGSWPADALTDIGADDDYFPDGLPTDPVDSTAYALDGTSHRVTGHSH